MSYPVAPRIAASVSQSGETKRAGWFRPFWIGGVEEEGEGGAGQLPARFGGWEVADSSVHMPPKLAEYHAHEIPQGGGRETDDE